MFRTASPRPMAYVERRLTPRTGHQGGEVQARVHRERDFGVGYGNSSGYAADRRYTRDWGNAHFRFA